MPEITREYLTEKRKALQADLLTVQGALQMLDMIEADLFPPEALTLEDLKKATCADSVEVLPEESEGNHG